MENNGKAIPPIRIELPAALRVLAENRATIEARGETVAQALDDVGQRHPLLLRRILTRGGQLRPHVNLFVNETDIRHCQGLDTALGQGDVLVVVPSVAGG